MWLIVESQGQWGDTMEYPLAVAETPEEVWKFAEEHIAGNACRDNLDPTFVNARYVPKAGEYPAKNPKSDPLDIAYNQDGKWALHER
jgi:hypothetical protein